MRSFDSVSSCGFGQANEAIDDIAPFGAVERMNSVTVDDVRARAEELFRQDAFAAAVMHRSA